MIARTLTAEDGATIAYTELGSGTPLTLIQGLGMPGIMWLDLATELAAEGFHIVMPDNRGVGRSSCPPPPYGMGRMADDVALVIREAFGGPSLVLGGSMGGMIAQHLTLRHPSLVRALLLGCTTPGLLFGRAPRPALLVALIRLAMKPAGLTQGELLAAITDAEAHANLPQWGARWTELISTHPTTPQGFVGQLTAAAAHNTYHALPHISAPTRIVAGASDRLIPSKNSEILARRIPNATLRMIPNTGHLLHAERPQIVLEEIMRMRDQATSVRAVS